MEWDRNEAGMASPPACSHSIAFVGADFLPH
jgi:hypothetical protein